MTFGPLVRDLIMNDSINVAVVEGGLFGLAAAVLFTRRGRKATVFEGSH